MPNTRNWTGYMRYEEEDTSDMRKRIHASTRECLTPGTVWGVGFSFGFMMEDVGLGSDEKSLVREFSFERVWF
jgi:hypothetical protein